MPSSSSSSSSSKSSKQSKSAADETELANAAKIDALRESLPEQFQPFAELIFNRPKTQSKTDYLLFSDDERARDKKKKVDVKEIAKRWHALSTEDKEPWVKAAANAKRKLARETAEWESAFSHEAGSDVLTDYKEWVGTQRKRKRAESKNKKSKQKKRDDDEDEGGGGGGEDKEEDEEKESKRPQKRQKVSKDDDKASSSSSSSKNRKDSASSASTKTRHKSKEGDDDNNDDKSSSDTKKMPEAFYSRALIGVWLADQYPLIDSMLSTSATIDAMLHPNGGIPDLRTVESRKAIKKFYDHIFEIYKRLASSPRDDSIQIQEQWKSLERAMEQHVQPQRASPSKKDADRKAESKSKAKSKAKEEEDGNHTESDDDEDKKVKRKKAKGAEEDEDDTADDVTKVEKAAASLTKLTNGVSKDSKKGADKSKEKKREPVRKARRHEDSDADA